MKKTFFIYFGISTQLLYAMEKSSLNIDKAIIVKTIKTVEDEGVFCACYGENDDTLIAITGKGCYIGNIQQDKHTKISTIGFNNNYGELIIYRRMTVSPDGKKIMLAENNSLEIIKTFEITNKISKTMPYPIDSVCFNSNNDSLFMFMKKNDDLGSLQKYTYEPNFHYVNAFQIDKPESFYFAVNKSTLCVMNSSIHKAIIKLYNSSDFTLQKEYIDKQLIQLADSSLNGLDCSIPCQINDDGFVALVGVDHIYNSSKLLIFQITDNNKLNFKRSISCKGNLFYNTLFYPRTSIIITISTPRKTNEKILQYWNFITGKCLHESLIDNNTYKTSNRYEKISNISISPTGENIAITTYYPGCTIYKIPTHIANRHAKKIGLNLCLFKELCDNIQLQSGLIPQEIRQKIILNMFFD